MTTVENIENSMKQTDEWIEFLRSMGRKENTLYTHRMNVRQCLTHLMDDGRSVDAMSISTDDILFLWEDLDVKETVKWQYLRSLSNMVEHYTGVDIVKRTRILHNRETIDRVFITGDDFRNAFLRGDEFQRVILCLGAYMGLRRAEMANIRDSDIVDGTVIIHGKGHGVNGHMVVLKIPDVVQDVITDYRRSDMKRGLRRDDYLLQQRDRRGELHRVHPAKISDSINRLGKEDGIRMTTHSLRRFFATTLYYDVGCDLQTMRGLMRHADISTTLKCYVDADGRKGREASDRLQEVMGRFVEEKVR